MRVIITTRTTLPWLRRQVQRRLDENVDFTILGQGERARKLLVRLKTDQVPDLFIYPKPSRRTDGRPVREWWAWRPPPGHALSNYQPDLSEQVYLSGLEPTSWHM